MWPSYWRELLWKISDKTECIKWKELHLWGWLAEEPTKEKKKKNCIVYGGWVSFNSSIQELEACGLISMSSRPTWFTEKVSGQPGLQKRNPVFSGYCGNSGLCCTLQLALMECLPCPHQLNQVAIGRMATKSMQKLNPKGSNLGKCSALLPLATIATNYS